MGEGGRELASVCGCSKGCALMPAAVSNQKEPDEDQEEEEEAENRRRKRKRRKSWEGQECKP